MKWFKHMTNFRNLPWILKLRHEFGDAKGYGMACMVYEMVAEKYESGGDPIIHISKSEFKKLLGINERSMIKFELCFSSLSTHFIKYYENTIQIEIGNMFKLKDNHQKNLQADKNRIEQNRIEKKKNKKNIELAYPPAPKGEPKSMSNQLVEEGEACSIFQEDAYFNGSQLLSSAHDSERDNNINEVISFFNEYTKKNIRLKSKSARESIGARLGDGFSVDDCKKVIRTKSKQWLSDEKMSSYVRISTLFRPTKFEDYLNEEEGLSEKEILDLLREQAPWL